MNQTEHPHDEDIAAFLDGTVSASERATVARHLSTCDDCRALLGAGSATYTDSSSSSRTRARGPMWAALVSSAAAAVFAINVSLRSQRLGEDAGPVRASDTSALELPVLNASSPADGAVVFIDTLVFRWASAGPGATYDVSVVDEAGAKVWSTKIDSTGLALPGDVRARLRASRTYYWRVDALLRDLRTASTGPRGFVPVSR